MQKKFIPLIGLLFISQLILSQPSSSVFTFLDFSPSARLTALGQYGTALVDEDPAFAFSNPANLDPEMDFTASFQHAFQKPSIQMGRAFIADQWKEYDLQYIAGLSYASYGELVRADEFGNINGNFQAKDLSLFAGISKKVYEHLQAGIAFEYVQSQLAEFQSNGLVTHLGLLYKVDEKQLAIGLSWKNIGWQWNPYYQANESIRSDLQIAISKRLAHLPFRFSFIYHDLNRWNLLYDSPVGEENVLIIDEDSEESPFNTILNNFARHLAVNGEFFIGKNENIRLRLGYDHQRRREMSVQNWNSLAGFSFGVGVKIKGITLDYGYANYHFAGGINHLGIRMQWNELFAPDIL